MPIDSSSIPPVTEAHELDNLALPPNAFCPTETILLVEDDQMVRTLARHILELVGYKVLEASTGVAAMQLCQSHKATVHLLLTDVVMPQMSGPQLREEVTRMFPDIKVIYMSGYSDTIIMGHGVTQDEVPFLQKPFSPDGLALKVRELLDTKLEQVRQTSDQNSCPRSSTG